MNLTSFKSLEPCCKSHLLKQMENAAQKVEIFVDGVEPQLFHQFKLPAWVTVYLTTSATPLQKATESFTAFCQKVLYESMEVVVDELGRKKAAIGRHACKAIIILATLILIFFPLSVFFRSALFFVISLVCWLMYQVYQYQVKVEVSQIKRRTQFRILNDYELANLPSLYIIDEDQIFIGGNLWDDAARDQFFEVSSFEEGVALKLIYRDYANSHQAVAEETILSRYLQAVGWD